MTLYKGTQLIAGSIPDSAKKDLSNIVNSSNYGTSMIAHYSMMSNTCTLLSVGASNTEYTAPTDGYYVWRTYMLSGGYMGFHAGFGKDIVVTNPTSSSCQNTLILPISRNNSMRIFYSNINTSGDGAYLAFVYSVGSAWEKGSS